MKILHTSDWHLGKRLVERERLPEQIEILDEIAGICEERQVEVVLVAGDVFDTYLPPAEAEEVFFRAVKRLAVGRAVVVISGNHDDGVRLAAAAPIAAEEGVYIFGRGIPETGKDRPVFVADSGENFLLLENRAGERVYINVLPYPNEARLKEDKTEESYAEKTKRWIDAGDSHYDGAAAHILLSHLFVTGGRVSESERAIDLGGARAVPVENFPEEGYVALGHLHRRQTIRGNIHYSGAPLQYSFDEANTEKCVLLFETHGKSVSPPEEIMLTRGKKLVRLEADSLADALLILGKNPGKFVELTLHLTSPLTATETAELSAANEGLVSLKVVLNTEAQTELVRRSEMSAEELFTQYYRSRYPEDPAPELKELFLEILGEADE